MPVVKLLGHEYVYGLADILRLFYGECKHISYDTLAAGDDREFIIYSSLSAGKVTTWVYGQEKRLSSENLPEGISPKREVKRQLYFLLSRHLDITFPWGSLTGIRPTLVAREMKSAQELSVKYFVREDKASLALETSIHEDNILKLLSQDSLCGYIGIPFCPSRCSYCSFISRDAANQLHLLSSYSDAVIREIDCFFSDSKPKLSCLYVGGGTPTVLDNTAFRSFFQRAFAILNAGNINEITVEAGRADTITEHKLHTLHDLGVHRICINPQTMSDKTLALIGRKHTAEDFYRAYNAALKIGFTTVNMDLIAGLQGEKSEDFINSLEEVLTLGPENITIHTLSKKKNASIGQNNIIFSERGAVGEIDSMLIYADARLKEKGYYPYYLYKQKDTLGGHENTGYTKTGHECTYNVAMMSDQRSILAFGAGSVSKRSFTQARLKRCPNVRDVQEYISRAQEMAIRKRRFFEL